MKNCVQCICVWISIMIEIYLKRMWWVIPYASPDRRHLRDVPSPATGTQGYQIHVPFPVGICNCIAHLPPVKAKPLRGGWVCVLARMCRLRKSRDINFLKAGGIRCSLALYQGAGGMEVWNAPGIENFALVPSKKKIFLNGCRVQAETLRLSPSKKKIFLIGCRVQAWNFEAESIQKVNFPEWM